MNIEYIRAKNFLCVGEKPLEIEFKQYGNIVVIKGENLDVGEDGDRSDGEKFSNGAGKSSISEALVYGLYGETIRNKINHTDTINNINRKKLEVEVRFSKNNNHYRIVRTRKPDSLSLWENDTAITEGGAPAVQKRINSIVGLNHLAFINVACFGQHNCYNFLECKPADQRSIVESVLALDVYKQYSDTAKEQLKNERAKIKDMVSEFDKLVEQKSLCMRRIEQIEDRREQWKRTCKADIARYEESLRTLEMKMLRSNDGALLLEYEKSKDELETLKSQVLSLSSNKSAITQSVAEAQAKLAGMRETRHEMHIEIRNKEADLSMHEREVVGIKSVIHDLKSLKPGAECNACYSKISTENYRHVLALKENQLDSLDSRIDEIKRKISIKQKELKVYDDNLDKLKSLVAVADSKVKQLDKELTDRQARISQLSSIRPPDSDAENLVLREKASHIKETIAAKQNELATGDPYREILETTQSDLTQLVDRCDECKKDIKNAETLVPYYEFWVKAFGDDGIRSFVIEGIVPALNARIAYWLQYLINNKIKLTFDSQLDATIERNPPNGDPFVYNAICGGERQRIDLAISQAFAHVLMLSSGTRPSLIFLDEVATNIDRRGLQDIYKMICELAHDRQVFVITHDSHLLEMLEGADVITMRKENGFSVKLCNPSNTNSKNSRSDTNCPIFT